MTTYRMPRISYTCSNCKKVCLFDPVNLDCWNCGKIMTALDRLTAQATWDDQWEIEGENPEDALAKATALLGEVVFCDQEMECGKAFLLEDAEKSEGIPVCPHCGHYVEKPVTFAGDDVDPYGKISPDDLTLLEEGEGILQKSENPDGQDEAFQGRILYTREKDPEPERNAFNSAPWYTNPWVIRGGIGVLAIGAFAAVVMLLSRGGGGQQPNVVQPPTSLPPTTVPLQRVPETQRPVYQAPVYQPVPVPIIIPQDNSRDDDSLERENRQLEQENAALQRQRDVQVEQLRKQDALRPRPAAKTSPSPAATVTPIKVAPTMRAIPRPEIVAPVVKPTFAPTPAAPPVIRKQEGSRLV